MARHEVPILTGFSFADASGAPIADGEYRVIVFEGREITWHVVNSDPEEQMLPTVTMRADRWAGRDAYYAEVLVLQRFFSARSYHLDAPIIPMFFARQERGSEPKEWLSARHAGSPLPPTRTIAIPREVVVADDEELALALALRREGRNSFSPFHRFLAYWNALDVVFSRDTSRRDGFIEKSPRRATGWFRDWESVPANLVGYFGASNRNAIAHAFPTGEAGVLDPDAPSDFERLRRDTRVLDKMLRRAMEDRWSYPVYALPLE